MEGSWAARQQSMGCSCASAVVVRLCCLDSENRDSSDFLARSFAQLALAAEKTGSAIAVSKEPLDTPPLEIHRLGDRMLRRSARRISKVDESIRDLTRDMLRSMYFAKGIGLAAPQVGVAKQLLVIDLDLESASTPPLS